MNWTRAAGWVLTPALLMGVAACEQDDGPKTGWLTLAITDAPVDEANAVVVEFTGVEIKPSGQESRSYEYDNPRSINLLALNGGGSEVLLDGVEVPAGGYEWVRLKVNATADGIKDSYIELIDGSQHELNVPSGAQTGLKLHSGFAVPAGGAASFTMDFDLRKSVHEPMNAEDAYTLRPTLRLVDNSRIGAIAGSVATALVPDGCTPAVYLFEGSAVAPDDVDGLAPEPVTTAIVKLDDASGTDVYRGAFLSEGAYTASYTCGAGSDDPAVNDTLTFAGTQNATVVAGQTTMVNFTAP